MSGCDIKQNPSVRDENAYSMPGKKLDPRFLKTQGIEVFTGNELLVKGALEAGVGLMTGYPGSPVSDVFEAMRAISPYLAQQGIVAQIAHNEGLACSRLNGARLAGLRSMAIMKSVGFHVGADALAVGNLTETRKREGGAVVVVGDDPWNETTQINSDSRFLSKHLHMPLVEPSTFQEMKDWVDYAFDLSGASDLYVTYLITTNQADGGATVRLKSHPGLKINSRNPATLSSDQIKLSDSVLIPPHTSMREATLDDRRKRFLDRARELGLNQFLHRSSRRVPVGFITSGLSYCYLKEVLQLLGLWETTPILKLGVTYPLDVEAIREMASGVLNLVIVEEKRGFIEEQVSNTLMMLKQEGKLPKPPALWGKSFPNKEQGFPSNRGLNASVMIEVLGPAFLRWKRFFPKLNVQRIEKELAEILQTKSHSYDVPLRIPTFCPGCPHRDSAVTSRKMKSNFINFDYMEKKKKKPMDVLFHGESGCHSMLQFSPYEGLMQDYSGMGAGGGTGAGMSPFVTNKQVVFLGDSTFFHSGLLAISDSVKNNQDITYVILENDTTAMTGHQPTPANDKDIMGKTTVAQDIDGILKGMFKDAIVLHRVDPAQRESYQTLLEETVVKPGVKVIISQKECAITFHRRKNREKKLTLREKGFILKEEKINITPEVCENCLECTRQTGCPGLTVEETPYGNKIATDLSTCVDDAACARTKACPSFEKVIIERSQPIKENFDFNFDTDSLPTPKLLPFEHRWCSYTAAVGGMGAGVVNAVLVRAGLKAGYHVNFLDKKGLAIRNGGVYGHVVFSKTGPVSSPVIPYGKADLLVGLDILEAARALDAKMNLRVAHPIRTHSVINTHKHQTVLSLIGNQNFEPGQLEKVIQSKIKFGGYFSRDFSQLSESLLGSKLYANMMILGVSYQMGWIPLKQEHLLSSIKESVKPLDVENNRKAFLLGRYIAGNPHWNRGQDKSEDFFSVVDEKRNLLEKEFILYPRKKSSEYKKIMDEMWRWLDLPNDQLVLMARMMYDLIRYENIELARQYLTFVWTTFKKDRKKWGFRATKAVIWNLYRCLAIKDEVWVAKLLTSPEKYQRDQIRYKIDSSRGDKISYRHLNRPQFILFGKKIEFDIQTRDWMLKIMSHAKFLRWMLPQWHMKEKEFREWYKQIVKSFTFFESKAHYDLYVQALDEPRTATGYRDIRYPRMNLAQSRAEYYISQIKALDDSPSNITVVHPEKSTTLS